MGNPITSFSKILAAPFIILLGWLIFLTLFVVIVLPLLLYRYIVSKIVPLTNKDYGKILNYLGNVCNQESLKITCELHLEGDLTLDEMRQFFMKRMVELKDYQGNIMYPELQEHLVSCMGFSFWKRDKYFNIEDHIFSYDVPEHKDNSELIDELLKGWKILPDRSPWRILLLKENFSKSRSQGKITRVVLQFHHALMDGFGLLLVMQKSMKNSSVPVFPISGKHNPIVAFAKFIWHIHCKAFLYFTDKNDYFDTNTLHNRNTKLINGQFSSPSFITAYDEVLPRDLVMSITQKYKVCRTTAIFTALTAALRTIMANRKVEIPKKIRLSHPVPKDDHPDAFINHFSITDVHLPVGIADPLGRLQYMKNQVKQSKENVVTPFYEVFENLVGRMPNFLAGHLNPQFGLTIIFSRLASLPNVTFFDKNVSRFIWTTGIQEGNISFCITCVGFNDHFQFVCCTFEDVLSKLEAKTLLPLMKEELTVLNQLNTRKCPIIV